MIQFRLYICFKIETKFTKVLGWFHRRYFMASAQMAAVTSVSIMTISAHANFDVGPAGRGEGPQAPYPSRAPPGDDRYAPRMDDRWGNGRQYSSREDSHDRCDVLRHPSARYYMSAFCCQEQHFSPDALTYV